MTRQFPCAILHVSKAEMEAHTLVHEFGHKLGLRDNPRHTLWDNPTHCTLPGCVHLHDHLGESRYAPDPSHQ